MKIKPKKSLGQNFLVDNKLLEQIANIGEITNEDVILEVGAGTGNLTEKLIYQNPKKIIAIEKDENLCKILKNKFGEKNNIKIINENIMNINEEKITDNKVIIFGNLPYNISTQILAKFISTNMWPPFYKKIIFMFQKEVADRILAKCNTKQYSRITILANFKLDVIEKFEISKKCFFPIPNVDSKIIAFKPKMKNNYKISNIKNLEKITHIFFSNKRKMINKPFSKIFDNYKEVAEQLKIDLNLRPSELSCNDYYRLTEYYEKTKMI